MRALLVAMDGWVRKAEGTAAFAISAKSPTTSWWRWARVQFPKIPGVAFPTRIQKAYHVDYGPEFRTAGIDQY